MYPKSISEDAGMKRKFLFVTGTICALALGWSLAWTAEKADTPSASADDYFRAIRSNDLKTLRQLLAANPADVRDKLDMTPLNYAALYGSVESVRLLLDAGADPNARNKSQTNPLIHGAYSFEKTKLLVEKGADVNAGRLPKVTD
jgi:ankyrin repeat protein